MSKIIAQSGAQSATITVDDAVSPEIGVSVWANLPKGKLKSLLNKSYATFTSFYEAYAAAGATAELLAADTTPLSAATTLGSATYGWELDAQGYPKMLPGSGAIILYQFRVSTSYSASE